MDAFELLRGNSRSRILCAGLFGGGADVPLTTFAGRRAQTGAPSREPRLRLSMLR